MFVETAFLSDHSDVIGQLIIYGSLVPAAAKDNGVDTPHGAISIEKGIALGHKTIAFEVAENGSRFAFDEAPIDDNGFPLYGNPFIIQGLIYPAGTLSDEDGDGVFNGVIVETDPITGETVVKPEFPDKVLGLWICQSTVFAQDGFNIETGPTVFSTQLYDFNEVGSDFGKISLMSQGLELIDVGKGIQRAITGGTGPYKRAEAKSSRLSSASMPLRASCFALRLRRDSGSVAQISLAVPFFYTATVNSLNRELKGRPSAICRRYEVLISLL